MKEKLTAAQQNAIDKAMKEINYARSFNSFEDYINDLYATSRQEVRDSKINNPSERKWYQQKINGIVLASSYVSITTLNVLERKGWVKYYGKDDMFGLIQILVVE